MKLKVIYPNVKLFLREKLQTKSFKTWNIRRTLWCISSIKILKIKGIGKVLKMTHKCFKIGSPFFAHFVHISVCAHIGGYLFSYFLHTQSAAPSHIQAKSTSKICSKVPGFERSFGLFERLPPIPILQNLNM